MSLTRLGIAKLWGEDPESAWVFMRWWVPQITRFLAPGYGYGAERIPLTGGGVVAANHLAGVDPALVGSYTTRTIYYMTKIELLSTPVVGEMLRWTGAFAVRRGEGDRDSLRVARWVAREGHMVGMFMEGTRQQLGYPGPAHPGAAMVAIQEGVPIVPCGVDTFQWRMGNRRPCCVVWGEPILLDGLPRTGRGYKEGAALLEEELRRLWRLAAETTAAGFPERLPDGARRTGIIGPFRFRPVRGLRPWPDEAWAEEPLGPVYKPPAPPGAATAA